MDEQDKEQIDYLRKAIRRSRELAVLSQRLRLRSEEVIGRTETLLQQYWESNPKPPGKKPDGSD